LRKDLSRKKKQARPWGWGSGREVGGKSHAGRGDRAIKDLLSGMEANGIQWRAGRGRRGEKNGRKWGNSHHISGSEGNKNLWKETKESSVVRRKTFSRSHKRYRCQKKGMSG